MASGFRDLFALVLGWKSAETQLVDQILTFPTVVRRPSSSPVTPLRKTSGETTPLRRASELNTTLRRPR